MSILGNKPRWPKSSVTVRIYVLRFSYIMLTLAANERWICLRAGVAGDG